MKKFFPAVLLMAGTAALGACDAVDSAMTAHTDIVARAAGYELTVDETAALLAGNEQLPPRPEVAQAFANLWVDYTLLAEAASRGEIESMDFSGMVRPQINQALVYALRDRVIQPDTVISDDELRQLYNEGAVGVRVRASHILLRVPANAEQARKDSIRAVAEDLRRQILNGADFASLASEHSQDPGSADSGGDLGFFARGQMVAPFEEAAFTLDVGDVSEVVETEFGYHIIKVTDRQRQELEGMEQTFRRQEKTRRLRAAEQAYITQLTEPRDITVDASAYAAVRELTDNAGALLSGRAASRTLVRYEGGALTAGEYLRWVRGLSARQREQLLAANDERLASLLEQLTINEILIAAAREQVPGVEDSLRDSLMTSARRRVQTIVSSAGFSDIAVRADENRSDAVSRVVNEFLTGVMTRGQSVWPLGNFAYALRSRYGAEVFDTSLSDVVERVTMLRSADQETATTDAPLPESLPAPNAPRERPAGGAGDPDSGSTGGN